MSEKLPEAIDLFDEMPTDKELAIKWLGEKIAPLPSKSKTRRLYKEKLKQIKALPEEKEEEIKTPEPEKTEDSPKAPSALEDNYFKLIELCDSIDWSIVAKKRHTMIPFMGEVFNTGRKFVEYINRLKFDFECALDHERGDKTVIIQEYAKKALSNPEIVEDVIRAIKSLRENNPSLFEEKKEPEKPQDQKKAPEPLPKAVPPEQDLEKIAEENLKLETKEGKDAVKEQVHTLITESETLEVLKEKLSKYIDKEEKIPEVDVFKNRLINYLLRYSDHALEPDAPGHPAGMLKIILPFEREIQKLALKEKGPIKPPEPVPIEPLKAAPIATPEPIVATPAAVEAERHGYRLEETKVKKYKNPEEDKVKIEKNKKLETEIETIKSSYDKMESDLGVGKELITKGKENLKDIYLSEDEKVWIEEKNEAEKLLGEFREQYSSYHKKSILEEQDRSWTEKLKDAITFKKLRRSLGYSIKSDMPTEEFKQSREAYDIAKKRYGNAIANLHWNKARSEFGDIPFDSDKYKETEALISKDLLINVSAKEYEALRIAKAETLPAKEKSLARKLVEVYTHSNKYKRLVVTSALLALGTAGFGIGATTAIGIAGARIGFGLAGMFAASVTGATVGKLLQKGVSERKEENLEIASKNFSILQNANVYEVIESHAEIERFKAALQTAGASAAAAVIIGGGLRFGAQIENLTSTHVAGAESHAPTSIPPTDQPFEKGELIQTKNIISNKENFVENETPTTIKPDPETIKPKTFIDEIKDEKIGRKIKHDSAELSLKKNLERNAEELGWKKESGVTAKKWAELEATKYAEAHPEIRNAITHDGNKLIIEKNTDGSWDAKVEQGSGRKVGLTSLKNVESSPKIPETTKVIEITETQIPKEIPVAPKTGSIDIEHNQIDNLVKEEYKSQLKNVVRLGERSHAWKSISKLKVEELLKAKQNIPEFVRAHNIASPSENKFIRLDVFGDGEKVYKNSIVAVRNLRDLVIAGEKNGLALQRNETVASYFERLSRYNVSKRI